MQHQTSREDEPQLHTHTLMANMTRDSQGHIKNLASQKIQDELVKQGTFERILHDQKYYSALYHSALGVALKEMGYELEAAYFSAFQASLILYDADIAGSDDFHTRE